MDVKNEKHATDFNIEVNDSSKDSKISGTGEASLNLIWKIWATKLHSVTFVISLITEK